MMAQSGCSNTLPVVSTQIPDYVQFCKDHKLALMAAVPLAAGEVLTSKTLVHEDMTAAQAALHWNMVQGVAVVPGAETVEQIIENCATSTKLSLAPVEPPEPLVKLMHIYGCFETILGLESLDAKADCGDNAATLFLAMCRTATRADCGILKMNEAGQLVLAVDGARARQDVAKKGEHRELEQYQMHLLCDIGDAIGDLGSTKSVHVRRDAIDTYLKTTQRCDTGVAGTPVAAHRQHEVRPAQGQHLTSMRVLQFTALEAFGSIPRRSVHAPEADLSKGVDALSSEDRVLFFSHRWLTPMATPERAASPDDAHGTKFRQIVAAVKTWCAQHSVDEEHAYVWIDFCCIEQDDLEELIRGVNSLGLYVCSCDSFITIRHEARRPVACEFARGVISTPVAVLARACGRLNRTLSLERACSWDARPAFRIDPC